MMADPKDTAESKPRSAGSYESGGTSALAVSIDNEFDSTDNALDQNSDANRDQELQSAPPASERGAADDDRRHAPDIRDDAEFAAQPEKQEFAADEPVFAEDPDLTPRSMAADSENDAPPIDANQSEAVQIFQDNLATETVFAEENEAISNAGSENDFDIADSTNENAYVENAEAALAAEPLTVESTSAEDIDTAGFSEYDETSHNAGSSESDDLATEHSFVDEPVKPSENSFTTENSVTEETASASIAESSPDNSMAASPFEEAMTATEPMEEPMNEYGMNAMRESAAQTEAAYENTFKMFEQASHSFRTIFDEAGHGAAKLTFKFFEYAQATAESNMELAREYASVRSIPEVLDVQAAYMKRQLELLTSQVGELREITTEIAAKSAKPFKEQMDQSIKSFQHHQ